MTRLMSGVHFHAGQARRQGARRWWNNLPPVLRRPAWPFGFAALAILALLLGFQQVVREAVQRGELLRASAVEAVEPCQDLAPASARQRCLADLDTHTVRDDDQPPPNTASLSPVHSGG
jgi:hypothetical protein